MCKFCNQFQAHFLWGSFWICICHLKWQVRGWISADRGREISWWNASLYHSLLIFVTLINFYKALGCKIPINWCASNCCNKLLWNHKGLISFVLSVCGFEAVLIEIILYFGDIPSFLLPRVLKANEMFWAHLEISSSALIKKIKQKLSLHPYCIIKYHILPSFRVGYLKAGAWYILLPNVLYWKADVWQCRWLRHQVQLQIS